MKSFISEVLLTLYILISYHCSVLFPLFSQKFLASSTVYFEILTKRGAQIFLTRFVSTF